MPQKTNYVFGRQNKGRTNICRGCLCCGTSPLDMPAVIYGRTTYGGALGGPPVKDYYVPMYRDLSDGKIPCVCGGIDASQARMKWTSFPFNFEDDAPDGINLCCQIFELTGSCDSETQECAWVFKLSNPMDHAHDGSAERDYFLTVPDDISCDGMSGQFTSLIEHYGTNCYHPGGILPIVIQEIAISQTQPVTADGAAPPCFNLCCSIPLTMYLTVNTGECYMFDDTTVEVSFRGASFSPGFGPVYNTGGAMYFYWHGFLRLSGNCPVPVLITASTWSGPEETSRCTWSISVGRDAFECFADTEYVDGRAFCPPVSFSGTFDMTDEHCQMCHCEFDSIEVSFELDL